jgi:hypothetical protein
MNTWFRKVGVGAVALTLAGVLGGCNNGDGGGLIRLYFGINGNGNCNQVTVEVDLDAADAVLAYDDQGALQCALNSALVGCNLSINAGALENGDLIATISGCTIPAVSNLFSCLFEDVDLSELQETASAICACRTPGCDGNPPVCISEDPDPTSCENCTNGRDDDGNGLTDCEDPNCRNSPACQETTTTSTTSTSVTVSSTTTTDTVTTTSSTTTSTTNPLDLDCRVVFTLEDDVTAGALQFDVDYSDVPGTLPGSGSSAQCAKLIPTALFALNDVDATETATMGFVDLSGMSGPNLDLAECQFKASATPLKSDFAITVTDATDASDDGFPIEPLPTVKVGTISCEGPVTTTTTTLDNVTTTTIDGVTTTTTGGGGPQNYDITFNLATASAAVSSLQFDVNYAAATGGFQGSGSTVSCTKQVVTALFAPNDVEATSTLTLGLVDLDGFTAPRAVAKCTFNGDAGDPPVPGDFLITIVDSTNADGDPVSSTVTTTVTPQ